ncbi:hypothetical protein TK90_1111 [Thioalkalivibrio sp. K90mix]|uniref:DUF3320 domain-containing protein n=1 Tax=Thioalkalivibrio sp. (strain K90mix) TaxID=396595 RepID=UPI000195A437|nr:DUF3320 domain-containing protein [Thioalkalivibrio sp. K90mix]ADC71622.1 hypothetical protein TK90_1111 [Thioalkalivibrio sp. K90mix]
MSETAPGALEALVRAHQHFIQHPGPNETCAAWRSYCRDHDCEWVTTWDTQPYRETETNGLALSGHDRFDDIPQEALDRALLRIADTEGPVHLVILTRRLLEAAGFSRAGSRIQARIHERRAALGAQGLIRLEGEFSGRDEQFTVPCLRDWSNLPDALRQLDHVPDTELTLSLVRTVAEAGTLDRDMAMNDALHRMGFIRLTDNARDRLQDPLAKALERGLLVEWQEILEAGANAFRRPRNRREQNERVGTRLLPGATPSSRAQSRGF